MKHTGKLLSAVLTLALILGAVPVPVHAIGSAYSDSYNIYNAVAYAKTYGDCPNPGYPYIGSNAGGDCTNFVSQCLIAGGLQKDAGWTSDQNIFARAINAYDCFINAPMLKNYLSSKGYRIESFSSPVGSGSCPAGFSPAAGDIVMLDYDGDSRPDHSLFCIGRGSDGMPHYAAHSNNTSDTSFAHCFSIYAEKNVTYYVIRMSNVPGDAVDITADYFGKKIALYSCQSCRYVSCNTDEDKSTVNAVANRSSVAGWEVFTVEPGDYGTAGLRAYNGNYLSACLNAGTDAPVRAAYGRSYEKPQSWESFRIYRINGNIFLQSLANGKWVQAYMYDSSYPLRASGKAPSTWEMFSISVQ